MTGREEIMNVPMSQLGFGLMRLPEKDGKIDIEHTNRMVDAFIAGGGKYFDTAYVYHNGESEVALRECITKRYPRESFFAADKLPSWMVKSPGDMLPIFEEQLKRTGLEYFDFYLIHAIDDKAYPALCEHGAFSFVQQLKAEGRARHIGFSYHGSAELLDKLLGEHPEMEFVQLQLNYFDVLEHGADQYYAIARKHGVPIIVMSSVRGGMLSRLPNHVRQVFAEVDPDASAASWALRFAAGQEGVFCVLSGMSDIGQVEENMPVFSPFVPLSEAEHAVVKRAAEALAAVPRILCTACKYCVSCPAGVAIDELFTLYNQYLETADWGKFLEGLKEIPEDARADKCIDCGACIEVCPQQLDIPALLREVAANSK